MSSVVRFNVSRTNQSVTKFKLFIKLIEFERANDIEKASKLNNFIQDVLLMERDSGEYISQVKLENEDLVDLISS